MPESTTLQQEIASILSQNLNVEVPSIHHDLIETGLLDSLAIVELLVELENHFALKVPLQDLEIQSFRSIASIARLVANLKGEPQVASSAASAASNQAMPSTVSR